MTSSLIIDSDGGIDDALAILTLVASRRVSIALINATSGNVGARQVYKNIIAILNLCGKKIQVSKGRNSSLDGKRKRVCQVHGRDGLGNTFLANTIKVLNPLNALEAFKKTIETGEAKRILAIGPLTNIANAFLKYPFLCGHVDEMWVVGGALKTGKGEEITKEFNFYFDPQAAEIVLSAPVSIKLITLDVTKRVLFDKPFIKNFEKKKNSKLYDFFLKILNFSYCFNRTKRGLKAAHLPDLIAACLFLNESLVDFRKIRISIDKKTGHIIRSLKGKEILLADNLRIAKIKERAICNLLALE